MDVFQGQSFYWAPSSSLVYLKIVKAGTFSVLFLTLHLVDLNVRDWFHLIIVILGLSYFYEDCEPL